MRKQAICFAVGLLGVLLAHGQATNLAGYTNPVSRSFGVLVGTTGVGVEYYHPLGNQFGVQAGVSFMPFGTKIVGTYGDYETQSKVRARLHNVHALFGWTPFYQTDHFLRHFVVNVGASYLLRAEGGIDTRLSEPYYYGDILVDQDMVGSVKTTVNWKQSVSPYFGIGLTDVRIDSRFGFNVGLGAYYLSSPSVRVKGTKLLEDNEANAPIIERNIKSYRVLPQVQLGVNYRLHIR
ncbi:hypothetical protein [Parapedobacter sp. 10938]|uniref:hypothetical protein n=1 Tax=Parapedobacter flavus TaxID=3110225 RepID=UPI002DB61CDB|nr:hypothetical protein [Parapedobacter sp. 10938]MEC3879334.1 hypothetical protein [Parapedobacter sp. 10938]